MWNVTKREIGVVVVRDEGQRQMKDIYNCLANTLKHDEVIEDIFGG